MDTGNQRDWFRWGTRKDGIIFHLSFAIFHLAISLKNILSNASPQTAHGHQKF
jgi:hypothetical protein